MITQEEIKELLKDSGFTKEQMQKICSEVDEEIRLEKLRREKEEREYYEAHFEEIMLDKIDRGETLTESEVEELVWSYGIDTDYDEPRRWNRIAYTVIELNGRHFMLEWDQALTEMQEHSFWSQKAREVKKVTKTIVVETWDYL